MALFFFTMTSLQAQEREPLRPQASRTVATQKTKVISPFELIGKKGTHDHIVEDATYLHLNADNLKSALKKQPREMIFEIPLANGEAAQLLLEKQEILTEDFQVTDQDGNALPFEKGQFYTGRVLDREHSEETAIASLSIVGGEIMGMMSIDHENYVLGALSDATGRKTAEYVLYSDADLDIPNTFECGTKPKHHLENPSTSGNNHSLASSKIVEVQFEADNQMYQDFGSSSNAVTNYVTGLFNMVATIYQNENIVTQISHIVVWTVADPYPLSSGNSSGDVLNAYKDRKQLVGINGDLAHLLSTKPLGHGGIAWIDVLCYPTIGYRTAYSNISTSYNNFPLYSWTIDVVTHEMGHNLGSGHTHDCIWGAAGNQALDNCASPSGGCAAGPAPTNGGTIMSYCHLTAAGKNFNLGFGSQPGSRIRSKVNAASCLGTADLVCNNPTQIFCGEPVSGNTTGGVNNVNYYSCNSWYQSGPEKVFMLQTTEPGTITASLSNLSADLDVIILEACSESSCLAEGNNTAVVPNAPAGQYFIVVDGYYGAAGSFTLTVNCEGPCYSSGYTGFEFIDRVEAGSIDNQSGNDYGYADFTNMVTQVHRGGSTPVTLTPGFISSPWNEYWRIWVDINKDNDFNDYGELVYDSGSSSNSAVSGNMNIPSWAQLGTTRMRVAMRFGSKPTDCGTFSGEVEDYTVEILPYCPSLGNSKFEFIEAVDVDGFANVSGDNDGYADFTGLGTIELLKGQAVPVSLTPGFNGSSYSERWSVYIDLNQDFHFNETTELVFSTLGGSPATVNGSFTVPTSALTGDTRMRVVMHYGSSPTSCSYNFWGETEDYAVSITPFCTSAGATPYEFIQTVGIGDLLNDSGDDGGYADFTDLGTEVAAGDAVGVVLVPGFAEGEYKENWKIWIDFDQDQRFEPEEEVFAAGPSAEMVFGAIAIPADVEEGKYGLRVSMRYGAAPLPCGNFAYGEVEDYRISITEGGEFGSLDDRSNNGSSVPAFDLGTGDLTIFPNPAKTNLELNWGTVQPIAGQLVSASGQTMVTFDASNIPDQLDVSEFTAGLYLLQVIAEDNSMITKRFVKVD